MLYLYSMRHTNQNEEENITVRSFLQKYVFSIIGIVVVILNLWLATKLTPLATDIAQLSGQVRAIETHISTEGDIPERIVRIETLLTEINNKLEKIDNRLLKHIGL